MAFKYRLSVLEQLATHGVVPGENTTPAFIHDFINDLYLFEIRRLRNRMRAGEFLMSEYSGKVAQLRERYPILSLPIRFWTEDSA